MNTSFTIRDGASEGRTDTGIDEAMRRLVDDAVEALRHGQPGILLIGTPGQARIAVEIVLQHLRAGFEDRLIPVRVRAPNLTPTQLRERVGEVHAARIEPSAWLLLVLEEADALPSDLLAELEMAAAAAAELGGLQFLFTANRTLATDLEQHGLPALSACLATGLPVPDRPPEARIDHGLDAAADQLRPRLSEQREEPRPSGLRARILIALLAIAAVVLVVAIGIGVRGRHAAPVVAPVAAPVAGPSGPPQPAAAPTPGPARQDASPAPAAPVTVGAPAPTPAPMFPPQPPGRAAPVPTPPPAPVLTPPPAPVPTTPTGTSLNPSGGPTSPSPVASPAPAPAQPRPASSPSAAPSKGAPGEVAPMLGVTSPAGTPSQSRSGAPDASRSTPATSPAPLPPPQSSLVLVAVPGDTLQSLYARVYRGLTPPPFADVVAANPGTIRPGTRLVFPAPPGGWRSL